MIGFFTFIGFVVVIVAVVLLYSRVVPKKFDGTFNNKILQFVHDYFNFKKLYIESVLKFVFTLLTVVCIVAGVLGMVSSVFGFIINIAEVFRYSYLFASYVSTFFGSAIVLVLSPIALRIVYESILMFVLLVKNVIEINNKTKEDNNNAAKAVETPTETAVSSPVEENV